MRYWIKLGKGLRGPLSPEELAVMPGMSPHALICPEGKDPKRRTHWDFARSFPDVKTALEKPREGVVLEREAVPEPAWTPPAPEAAEAPAAPADIKRIAIAVPAALLGVMLWRVSWKTPSPAPRPHAEFRTGVDRALHTRLLSCGGRTVGELGRDLHTRWLSGSRYEISWGRGTQEVRLEYDEETRQLKPLSAAARSLGRLGVSCPR